MSPSTNLLQNESNWMELERSWWWIGLNAIFIGGYILITVPLSEKPCSDFEHWYRRHRILTVHSLEAKNGKKANLKKMMNSRYSLHLRTLRLAGRIKCQWLIDRVFTDMLDCGRSANVLIITSLITETIKVYGIQRRLTHVWQTIEKS